MRITTTLGKLSVAGLFGVALLLAGQVSAAVLSPLGRSDLARSSELIVAGEVLTTTTGWDTEKRLIFTWCTVQPEKALKGNTVSAITVAIPGGTVEDGTGTLVMDVPGTIYPRAGQRVLLFLDQTKPGTYGVMGLTQGLWEVRGTGADAVAKRMAPLPGDLTKVTGQRSVAEVPWPNEISLQALETEISTELAR